MYNNFGITNDDQRISGPINNRRGWIVFDRDALSEGHLFRA